MIPEFVLVAGCSWKLLPPGIHEATIDEIYTRYAINERRMKLYRGFRAGVEMLFKAGCPEVYLDGSYVTGKPLPNDYEVCWDLRGVNPALLDPLMIDLKDLNNGRPLQKEKYFGEYFPAGMKEGKSGKPFVQFFQTDRETGVAKGIILLKNFLKI